MEKLSKYDIYLISSLAQGATLKQVRTILRSLGQKPNSESSVDKRLQYLRKKYQCKTNPHLVYNFRDQVISLDMEKILK